MWKSEGERSVMYGGCWSVSQPNILSLSLTRLAVSGLALSCKRKILLDRIPGRFDFMARFVTLRHQESNHPSLRFFACLHFQCWTNTVYSMLTSRAIRKQLCGPAFSLCISSTLQMAVLIRNNIVASFCEECVLCRVFNFLIAIFVIVRLIKNDNFDFRTYIWARQKAFNFDRY